MNGRIHKKLNKLFKKNYRLYHNQVVRPQVLGQVLDVLGHNEAV